MHRPVFWLMPTWITYGVTSAGDDRLTTLSLLAASTALMGCCMPSLKDRLPRGDSFQEVAKE